MKISHVCIQDRFDRGNDFNIRSQERNLLDLATDFASPQVLSAVQTAYESKGKQKGNEQSKNRRRPSTNTKENKEIEAVG